MVIRLFNIGSKTDKKELIFGVFWLFQTEILWRVPSISTEVLGLSPLLNPVPSPYTLPGPLHVVHPLGLGVFFLSHLFEWNFMEF